MASDSNHKTSISLSEASKATNLNAALYSSPTTEINFDDDRDMTISDMKIDATPIQRIVNFSESIEMVESNITENEDELDSAMPISSHISSGSISILNSQIDPANDLTFLTDAIDEIQSFLKGSTSDSVEVIQLIGKMKSSLIKSKQLFNQINFKNQLFKISVDNQIERNEIEKNLLKNQIDLLNKFKYIQNINDKQKIQNTFQSLENKNIMVNKNLQKVLLKNKNLKIKVIEQDIEINNLKRKLELVPGEQPDETPLDIVKHDTDKNNSTIISSHTRANSNSSNNGNNKKSKLNNQPHHMLDTLGFLASQVLSEDRNKSTHLGNSTVLNSDTTTNDKTVDLDETIDLPHSSVIIR